MKRTPTFDRDETATALSQWKAALRFFENVNDPALMDVAIYELEAARRKYVFLLRRSEPCQQGERQADIY